MTFEQTMHTIESQLEALQVDYDRLLEENSELKEQLKALSDEDTLLARDMIVFASELSKALEGKPNDQ